MTCSPDFFPLKITLAPGLKLWWLPPTTRDRGMEGCVSAFGRDKFILIRAERSRPARCLSSFVAFPFNQALIKRYYDQIITAPQSAASPYENMTDDSKSKTTEAHGSKRTETGRNGPKRQPRLGTNETFRNGAEMCRDSTVSERFCANIVSARFGTFRFISVTYLVKTRCTIDAVHS